jgi:predicted RNA-binding protein with PIN domain
MMHYYIDGYNLLFRLVHAYENLQSSREQFILDLDRKISLVKIDVSIVFDGTFQEGNGTRTHFNNLEILFTSQGETADEFILNALKHSSHPKQETIVTSDKKLAWLARNKQAQTETVENFIHWLNKAYKNKLKKLTSLSPPQPKDKTPPQTNLPFPLQTTARPNKEKEGSTEYYEKIFEKEYQKLIEKEPPIIKKQTSAKIRKPKIKKDPFLNTPSLPIDSTTQMERWEKVFEERLKRLEN